MHIAKTNLRLDSVLDEPSRNFSPPSFHYYAHCERERAPLSYTRRARDSFSAAATRLKSLTVLFRNRCLYVAAPNWKYTYTALFAIIAVLLSPSLARARNPFYKLQYRIKEHYYHFVAMDILHAFMLDLHARLAAATNLSRVLLEQHSMVLHFDLECAMRCRRLIFDRCRWRVWERGRARNQLK